MNEMELLLEDGTRLPGRSFAAPREIGGEIVFNTGMCGYVEMLTDPSYRGQIVVSTYPLLGNYGVPCWRDDLAHGHESAGIQVQALVIGRTARGPSHFRSRDSLAGWLEASGVPALEGVDTRTLTQRLREHGTMSGWVVRPGRSLEEAREQVAGFAMEGACASVVDGGIRRYGEGGPRILLVDTGAKSALVRSLLKRGASVVRVPFTLPFDDLLDEVDGVLLSNGPGDPKQVGELVERVRTKLLPLGRPVLGVCLGHQVLALAAGADTEKLRYGHRSQNQPVRDLVTGRCYVTSQNHGYVVRDATLPSGWSRWFENVHDRSNEGIRCDDAPYRSVQFHPEGAPGPDDTAWVFDEFVAETARRSR